MRVWVHLDLPPGRSMNEAVESYGVAGCFECGESILNKGRENVYIRSQASFFAWFSAAYIIFAVAYIGFVERLSISSGKNLFAERTSFTRLSSIQIGVIAALSLALLLLSVRQRRKERQAAEHVQEGKGHGPPLRSAGGRGLSPSFTIWAVSSLFFAYLAIDEFYELHESGSWLATVAGQWGIELGPFFGELVLLSLYAPIIIFLYLRTWPLFRQRGRYSLLAPTGIFLLLLSLLIDQYLWPTVPVMFEDGLFKFGGFSFLLLAYLELFLARLKQARTAPPVTHVLSEQVAEQAHMTATTVETVKVTQEDAFIDHQPQP